MTVTLLGTVVKRATLHNFDELERKDIREGDRVVIEKGAALERTVVRGPAIIGAGARISDSYIGPYTAIDRDVVITGSEVEHSIVLAGSSIRDLHARSDGTHDIPELKP